MKRLYIVLLLLIAAAASWSAETFKITILHTNDMHGMMMPFNYTVENKYKSDNAGGLARRAALIKDIRKSAENPVILIDAGDIFTRGPWHTKFMGIPEVEAMNLIGYDMMCVGNNEFKAVDTTDSQKMMLRLMRRSKFPWLTANLTVGDTEVPVEGIHPFVVRDINGVSVGFMGLTAPRSSEYPQTAGWKISDPIDAAKKWAPLARKECDILIAITHIGDILDEMLVKNVAGIDAVVGGDFHTYIEKARMIKNPDGRDVPVVQAGEQGIVLGQLDLEFQNDNGWHLIKSDSKLIPITSAIEEDEEVSKLLNKMLDMPKE